MLIGSSIWVQAVEKAFFIRQKFLPRDVGMAKIHAQTKKSNVSHLTVIWTTVTEVSLEEKKRKLPKAKGVILRSDHKESASQSPNRPPYHIPTNKQKKRTSSTVRFKTAAHEGEENPSSSSGDECQAELSLFRELGISMPSKIRRKLSVRQHNPQVHPGTADAQTEVSMIKGEEEIDELSSDPEEGPSQSTIAKKHAENSSPRPSHSTTAGGNAAHSSPRPSTDLSQREKDVGVEGGDEFLSWLKGGIDTE